MDASRLWPMDAIQSETTVRMRQMKNRTLCEDCAAEKRCPARVALWPLTDSTRIRPMFTVVAQKNLPSAMRYFEEHLSRNDYYPVPEVHQGQWIDLGAEKLGLTTGQEVGREPFEAQCEKRHRHSGEHLTLPQNEKDNRRVFYDFTCASPKLVSILAVTLKGGRPVAAYEEAVAIDFRERETFADTRVRKQGRQTDWLSESRLRDLRTVEPRHASLLKFGSTISSFTVHPKEDV